MTLEPDDTGKINVNDLLRKEVTILKKRVTTLERIAWMALGALGLIVTGASIYSAFFKE